MDVRYLAGLFDGEGYVSLCRHHIHTSSIALKVGVVNTYRPVLEEIKSLFGGAIYTIRKETERHRQCYSWVATTTFAETFLKAVLPYLHIKRRQAEIGIEFRAGVNNNQRRRETTLEEKARREGLRAELIALNARRVRRT